MGRNTERVFEEMLSMHEAGQAAIANQEKLQQEGAQFVASTGGEASFAMPEALATAAGAAWLMGPAGILLGIAQGILGKREQQTIIDRQIAENDAFGEAAGALFDGLEQARMVNADNPENLAQIDAMQTQYEMALGFSRTPGLIDDGIALLTKTAETFNQFEVTNDAQAIAAQAKAAEVARQLTADQNAWYVGAQTRFRNETAPFKKVMMQTDMAIDAMTNGTPADLWAAIKLVNKALDETSAVMEGEVKATEAIGGYKAQLNTFLEQFRSGAQLGDTERKDLISLMDNIRSTNTKYATAIEIDYRDQMDTLDMPMKFYDDFKAVEGIPAVAPGEFKERGSATDAAIEGAATGFTDSDLLNNIRYATGGYAVDNRTEEQKEADLQDGLKRIGER